MDKAKPYSLFLIGLLLLTGFWANAADDKLHQQVEEALQMLKQKDSTFESALKKAHGYVIFPHVAKGGFIVGGAGGSGEVYQGGKMIGTAKLSAGSFGAQIGGQIFIEVVLFENEAALTRFKQNRVEMSAQISAVAAAEGVADKAEYELGMAVIILPKKGLMAEASVGGQQLKFIPLPEKR